MVDVLICGVCLYIVQAEKILVKSMSMDLWCG